uniref:Aha1_N domain-containing protein n=2 Tax=Macrostomum lignano TaxID=282301 RepID=A0A1I8J610_9PLAT
MNCSSSDSAMAKWGEGDPRWIVEERADAKNVNNWHWTEKNATQWSKDKLRELLVGFKVSEADSFEFRVSDMPKCDGEATANNRKAKLIFFYEWTITLDWEGQLLGCDNKTKFKGKVEVINLSEENSASEIDMDVSVESSSNDAFKLKELVRRVAVPRLQTQLGMYIDQLRTEFSQNLILPTKGDTGKPALATSNAAAPAASTVTRDRTVIAGSDGPKAPSGSADSSGARLATKKLTFKEEFFCAPEDLFRVFTQEHLLAAFVRARATADAREGGEFSLCDGSITGFFDELLPPDRLVMRWRHRKWPAGHHSICELKFRPSDGGTQLELVQTQVPEKEVEFTRNSWQEHYFRAIKQTFGYGGKLF